MFVISLKTSKRRLVPTLLCLALIAAMVISCLFFPATQTMVTSAVAVPGNSDEACASYLKSLGYTAELPSVSVEEIRLPDVFDETLTAYNALQLQVGFDLSAYAGQRIKLRTFDVSEHADGVPVQAHLYTYNGIIIGGDIAAASGAFTAPLCKAQMPDC